MNIPGLYNLRQVFQPSMHVLQLDLVSLQHPDLLVESGHHAFALESELFKQFFTGPQSGKNNLYVFIWLVAGEADHATGEIDDAHRLSHIQNKDFSTLSHSRSLQHQL